MLDVTDPDSPLVSVVLEINIPSGVRESQWHVQQSWYLSSPAPLLPWQGLMMIWLVGMLKPVQGTLGEETRCLSLVPHVDGTVMG